MESMDTTPPEINTENDCIDRISSLQDSILGKILSFLPTKNAVATSILSTRWKNLFPCKVPLFKINLDDTTHPDLSPIPSRTFVDFANKLLNQTLIPVLSVETVDFSFEKEYDDGQLVSWLSSVLRPNFRRLRLQASYSKESEDLLDALNGYLPLVELDLGCDFELYLPEDLILPNLKKMSLWMLILRDDSDSIRALLKGCPLLEDLSFNSCSFEVLDILPIRSRLLKRLSIEDTRNEVGCRVVIDAPNLEYFVYEGHAIADFAAKKFKSPIACSIGFREMEDFFGGDDDEEFCFNYPARVAKLVRACSCTVRLYLSGRAMKDLQTSSVELPKFGNLTCLALGRIGSEGWGILARMLLNAPNLESLMLEDGVDKYKRGGYAGFESSLTSVPPFLEKRFKKFELWKFRGLEDEFKLIEYFLMNGTVLQEVVIHCLPWENMSFFDRLFTFPKRSRACQILFVERDNWRTSYPHRKWY